MNLFDANAGHDSATSATHDPRGERSAHVGPSEHPFSPARQIFFMEVERIYRYALRAILRLRGHAAGASSATADLVNVELAQLEQKRAAFYARGAGTLPSQRLGALFGLQQDELDFMWAAVALGTEARLLVHAQALIGSEARLGMSLGLYVELMEFDAVRSQRLGAVLHPLHPLRANQLLISGGGALSTSIPYTIASSLLSFLLGEESLDPLLHGAAALIGAPQRPLFDAAQQRALVRIRQCLASAPRLALLVIGPADSGRRSAVAHAAERPVIALDLQRVASSALTDTLRALQRDCVLRGALPLLENLDAAHGAETEARLLCAAQFIEQHRGPVVLTMSELSAPLRLGCQVVRVRWPLSCAATRLRMWQRSLGGDQPGLPDSLEDLAYRYKLGLGGIDRAVQTARLMRAADNALALDTQHLVEGVRSSVGERLVGLAQRVEVRAGLEDVVLEDDILQEVKELIARIRYSHQVYERWDFKRKAPRGAGVAALFSGEPGTGKTLLAGVVARAVNLELYQVDLSQITSKWVGETEKQLARLFEAADVGTALLLFDEADALFAKRTKVRDSHDRFANLEVNYLLQRIESFGGVAILTTNFRTSIDPALSRRLAAHIVFRAPDMQERARLWRNMLPARAAVEQPIDFAELARAFPEMTGGNIRNAVLAAAFLAAADGSRLGFRHLLAAARGEYRAMGRV